MKISIFQWTIFKHKEKILVLQDTARRQNCPYLGGTRKGVNLLITEKVDQACSRLSELIKQAHSSWMVCSPKGTILRDASHKLKKVLKVFPEK